jgi:transposase
MGLPDDERRRRLRATPGGADGVGRRRRDGVHGPYWLPLAHWLAVQPGVTVVLVNPAHVKRVKELDDNTPTKSDAKDAGVIARLVAEGRFLPWSPREGVWAELQTLAVLRRQQRQAVSQWENRIAGWLTLYFPEFRQVFKRWEGKAALWVLDHGPLPQDVRSQGPEVLTAGMLDATHHRVGSKRARALEAAAATSVGLTTTATGALLVVTSLYPIHQRDFPIFSMRISPLSSPRSGNARILL